MALPGKGRGKAGVSGGAGRGAFDAAAAAGPGGDFEQSVSPRTGVPN